MTDSTTLPPAQTEADEAIIADPLLRRGFYQVPRAIVEDLDWNCANLYAIIHDYAQLSIRNRRPCVPTRDDLAAKLGCSPRTIETYVAQLRERGWIETRKLPNGRNRYILTDSSRRNEIMSRPRENGLADPHRSTTGTHTVPERSAIKAITDRAKTDNPPPPKGGSPNGQRGGGSFPSDENEPHSENMAQRAVAQSAPTKDSGVSNSQSRLEKEQSKAYWQVGKRLKLFQFILSHYPAQQRIDEVQAMQAWERTIGARIEVTEALDQRIFLGLQKWLRYWNEGNERWIPIFANWIAKERWDTDPFGESG